MEQLFFHPVAQHILRLCVPFEGIYAAVFLAETDAGAVLVDAACAGDGTAVILPALAACGVKPAAIFLTHDHRDHAEGLPELAAAFPGAQLFSCTPTLAEKTGLPIRPLADGDAVLGPLRAYALPGHTPYAAGLLDTRTGTLLTGDGLQLYGTGKFGLGVSHVAAYLKTLAKVADDPAVTTLIGSHDYAPLGDRADGREAVRAYARACRETLQDVADFVALRPEDDPKAVRAQYAAAYPERPPVPVHTIRALRLSFEGCSLHNTQCATSDDPKE